MVLVKICGITNWTDARHSVDVGADALGFNFYAKSPRYISPENARRIAGRLPRRVNTIGIFVNTPTADVVRIARDVDLNFVQLHGDESPSHVQDLARHYRVIKAFQVDGKFRPARLVAHSAASAFLLDGFDSRHRGGTGRTFDWTVARKAKRYGPLILSGGLTHENVEAAIATVRPFAVDVCSGVESAPGKKDIFLLQEFMRAVESARRRLE